LGGSSLSFLPGVAAGGVSGTAFSGAIAVGASRGLSGAGLVDGLSGGCCAACRSVLVTPAGGGLSPCLRCQPPTAPITATETATAASSHRLLPVAAGGSSSRPLSSTADRGRSDGLTFRQASIAARNEAR